MPKFGNKSKKNLSQAHPLLQELFEEVIKYYDCSVIEGHRTKVEQDAAFHSGKSKVKFPNSKHNSVPSMAVDVCPYPIDWNDRDRFYHFGGFVMGMAKALGIDLRWGGDWNNNNVFKDQTFHDLPHFELRSTEKKQGIIKTAKEYLKQGPSKEEIDISLEEIEDSIFEN